MPYALFADLVLLLHALFVVFVLLGGLLVLRHRKFAWLHLPCAAWGALIEFRGWVCPLTYLENDLRIAAGGIGYAGDFIGQYLLRLVYPHGLTPGVQFLLGLAVVLVNLCVYTLAWRRTRARRT